MKKWYIDFPLYQYKENVKSLAKERGLKIVDSKFQGNNPQCDSCPTLTLKSKRQIKQEATKISSEEANKLFNNISSINAEEVKALANYLSLPYTTKDDTIVAIKTKLGR